jgi:ligand-binding sensor domain-containing protein
MKKLLIFLLVPIFCFGKSLYTFQLDSAGEEFTTPELAGNGITDIKVGESTLWFGTGNGLSRTTDFGQTFETFTPNSGIGRGSVSALWVSGDTIWVATASDTLTRVSETYLDMGTGLSVSTDNGRTWTHYDQPGPTPVQNLSYDIAVHKGSIYIVSWGGGIRRSDDWGQTWTPVAPDTNEFDPGKYLNHRGFSATSTDQAIYIGTADGINKSTDNGTTWHQFTHANQANAISGDFVVALDVQKTTTLERLWAATWKAEGEEEEYGVSFSDDGGENWVVTLEGEKAHNFAFDDSIAYVATDNGLFKSVDMGQTWYVFDQFKDQQSGERIYTQEIYSAAAANEQLWVGTADGLAITKNNGYTWQVIRAFQRTGVNDEPRTYAYPNPFSPTRHNQVDSDGFVRFQFNTLSSTRVTIHIFDFAMDRVTTVVEHEAIPRAGDYTRVWNGKNDYGDMVANGVYFYSVELEGDGTYWGKLMILN